MGLGNVLLVMYALVCHQGFAGTHQLGKHGYKGQVTVDGVHSTAPASVKSLLDANEAACFCSNRALYAMKNYQKEIRDMFKAGMNFAVFFKHPEFYLQHIGNRFNQCNKGKINYRNVGRCGTEQGTLAYVTVSHGVAGTLVHLCDEFYESHQQASVVQHEFGRLENIGDSPDFTTDNIFVWDALIDHLCDETTYRTLEKQHGGRK